MLFLTPILLLSMFVSLYAHRGHQRRQLPALDPQTTNKLPTHGGPTLYYNGDGPVPGYNRTSPIPEPITPYKSNSVIEDNLYDELISILEGGAFSFSCDRCLASMELLHVAAITQPVSTITSLLTRLCEAGHQPVQSSTCKSHFATHQGGIGPYWAQLLAKMSMTTGDMAAWCHYQRDNACKIPELLLIDESKYFSPKPASAEVAPSRSGKTVDVLHISDWHLDPRYAIGSEANCTSYLCCRPYSTNTNLNTGAENPSIPASRYGSLYCDTTADLALSAFNEMGEFFNKSDLAFTIFTGDIVSHDVPDGNSRAYVEYEERVTYETFKAQMGDVPIYPTLGNHDSLPEAFGTPNTFNGDRSNALAWNYRLLSSMWQHNGWIDGDEAEYAASHYGAYAHTTKQGLRIISLNTDFWYTANIFNYVNYTNPDPSGILGFLSAELAKCEERGQKAWIIGHVNSGYYPVDALPNPSALFYSIVVRFSPATVAGVFFGHTHEDQLQLFYSYDHSSIQIVPSGARLRNTTLIDLSSPLAVSFIGPSITPLTGLNAGYRVYQVDTESFEITNYQTYIANMSDSLAWTEPVWGLEYDARDIYATKGEERVALDAGFWEGMLQRMEKGDEGLVEKYSFFEGKGVVGRGCTGVHCAKQKACYIRSGSAALGRRCPEDVAEESEQAGGAGYEEQSVLRGGMQLRELDGHEG